ncbi:MAG: hypothetical protein ACC650_04585 [Gammaproteobacteria bacterium]
MSNHITASIEFYFKGEKHSASIELDLDQHMQSAGKLPALYPLLARAINLDLYSYEYEMMQTETIMFNAAKGLVANYVNEGLLDTDAFKSAWRENAVIEKLQTIAQQNLSIEDLQQHPELKNALLEAYRLGDQTTENDN